MLRSLSIADFALVDRLEIDFAPGFNVLTGETGAGKSILLKALGLILGERADRDLVRTGAQAARVEGVFEASGPVAETLRLIAEEAGAAWEDSLVIARNVSAEGKSRAFVNGCSVGVSTLAALGAHLVEVSSQHQHQSLLDERNHLEILDRALDSKGLEAVDKYRTNWTEWEKAEAELIRIQKLSVEGGERKDYLSFQIEEIRAAGLKAGEDAELLTRREVLANAGKLNAAYSAAHAEIFGDEDGALSRIGRAARNAEKAAQHDPAALEALALLREAEIALGEAASRLEARAAASVVAPGEADEVEARLAVIEKLKRKHGKSVDEVLARLEKIAEELNLIENREEALADAVKALESAGRELSQAAGALTQARRRAAASLESMVGKEMAQLGFASAAFSVSLSGCEPCASGADVIKFMFAPNAGEARKPLAAIASGGELSRVLLAVKNAQRDGSVGTLVFDEVDAGIGGRTADTVGERLKALGGACQVVCVTHLPQIASKAAEHMKVVKSLEEGRTVTRVEKLAGDEVVAELARMLGGTGDGDAAWLHAKELAERGKVA